MRRTDAVLLALLLGAGVVACSPGDEATESAPEESETEVAEPGEGAPRLASSADGVHIEYRVRGRGEPAVVLVHGWSCDSNYWSEQLEALQARYTVVTVDLAGHGASGRNRTDWSMAAFGEDVAAVVRQLPHSRVILVGHSMGGAVVLEAAPRIGERVIGIIGVDALKTIGLPPLPPQQLEARMQPFRADFIGATREFVTRTMFTPDADPQFVRKVADDMALAPPEVGIGAMAGLNGMDFAAVLPQVRVPVVAINSDLGQPTDEQRIRQHLPDFRAVVLENTGHFLMLEAPGRFNPALLREIQALVDGAGGPAS